MGGKTSKTTSSVQIPQDVLNRYNAVNTRAEQAAQIPFQIYSTDPSAFVAPLTGSQQAGLANINASAGQAQPYFGAATQQLLGAQQAGLAGLGQAGGTIGGSLGTLQAANQNAAPYNQAAGGYYTSAFQAAQPYNQATQGLIGQGLAGAQPFNVQAAQGFEGALSGAQPYNLAATGLAAAGARAVGPEALSAANINQYMSPYLQNVLGSTQALLAQQNQIEQSGQISNAIRSGAFGGDRAGIAAANLAQQQRLANQKIYSDILNTGYGQALSTAQQQQGLGLSAEQANRAAQAAAAGQMAAIGQQQYGQGTGTAQAQAGLGQQILGQGLAGAGATQSLGQQVYGQGTGTGTAVQGLGQQVFGQGLATAQQQLAAAQAQQQLAQAQYGMGAGTAEQLAGLGTGAQGAALQGAQAQMGAGQVEQQTQQAGLQSLYNQFLQQQSYPFQVAQFLANIAMGTGSLSGSTTTTTQPGGFFSDKNLKEDIKVVGKTFDGQPIVTYRYKDDDPKVVRIGMIAQEVEKKHPEAVGEESGFKTVHYGKATEDAAKRGKFAYGGTPVLPGLNPSDFQEILQAQSQMYTPYGGGLYGGSASGAPMGGSSYVPSGGVAVSPLTVAPPPPAMPTAAEQVAQAAELGSDLAEGYEKFSDWREKRKKKAAGGRLYGEGIDIPDEPSQYELKTAETAGKPRSAGKEAVDTALKVAKLAAMAGGFADGGKVKRKAGFPGYKDEEWETYERPAAPFGTMVRDESQSSPYWRPFGGESGKQALGAAASTLANPVAAATQLGTGLGAALAERLKKPELGATAEWEAPARVAPVSRPAPQRSVVAPRAASVPQTVQPTGLAASVPFEPQAVPQVEGIAPPGPVGGLTPMPQPENLTAPRDRMKLPGYIEGLREGKTPNWVSLLSGIAAMGTAPTVHPGVALAAGLGAGTKAYMGAKQTEAELAKTAAETATEAQRPKQVQAQVAQTQAYADFAKAQTLGQLNEIAALKGFVVMPDEGGPFEFEGRRYAVVPKGSLTKGAAPTGEAPKLGPAAAAVAQNGLTQFATLSEPAQVKAQEDIRGTIALGSQTEGMMSPMREWGIALSTQKPGPLQPGTFSAWGRSATRAWNSTIDLLPVSPEQKQEWKIDPSAVAASEIAAKMQNTIAQARAADVDQRSLGALEANLASTPHEGMTREGNLTLWAQEMVQRQRDIDMGRYFGDVDRAARDISGMSYSFIPGDAQQAFWRDNPSSRYDSDRNNLAKLVQSPHFTLWMKALASGDPEDARLAQTYIDKQYGGVSRYLTGGP